MGGAYFLFVAGTVFVLSCILIFIYETTPSYNKRLEKCDKNAGQERKKKGQGVFFLLLLFFFCFFFVGLNQLLSKRGQ